MLHGIFDGDRCGRIDPEQREAFELEMIDNGLQIDDGSLDRRIEVRRLRREPRSATVVADDPLRLDQVFIPVAPLRDLPLEFRRGSTATPGGGVTTGMPSPRDQ